MSRWLLAATGWSALLLGAVAALVFGLALIDPVGTQTANDADPFGTPPSTAASFAGLAVAVAAKIGGIALILLSRCDPAHNAQGRVATGMRAPKERTR